MWSSVASIADSSLYAATITVTGGHSPLGHGPSGASSGGGR